jgi:hypothetical protein
MTYEEQLKVEELNKQIIKNIVDNVDASTFINFYLQHNQKETMSEFGLRTIKQLTKVLKLFNYDFSKPKPSKFKGKPAARSHESYIAGGEKSSKTQKALWAGKSEEEKQAWSDKQKIAHSSDAFKYKIKQINLKYQMQLDNAEKQMRNSKRSSSMKKYLRSLSEEELLSWVNRGFKLYEADDFFFDSFPELCFYLYHKQANYSIIRLPRRLEYFYNDKKHFYMPDFEVDGQLYEIKGDHLFEKLLQTNTQDNAKYRCMLKNNVKILQKAEYSKYEKWFLDSGLDKTDFLAASDN